MTPNPTPQHVAIVMDGNGRWAQQRHHLRTFGHLRGVQTAKQIMLTARDAGVRYLTLYTFSMENWQRPKTEVAFLMRLIERYFQKDRDFLVEQGVRIRIMGHEARIPTRIQHLMADIQQATRHCSAIQVNLAFSYSGRQEILDAIASLSNKTHIQASDLAAGFYLPDLPDPELLIRTGGEYRLSNFLLWQVAYTELYFMDRLWPDFSPADFHTALSWYAGRTRKFGQVSGHERSIS